MPVFGLCITQPKTHKTSVHRDNNQWYIWKLTNAHFMALICAWWFGSYRFTRLPFGVPPAGDMFQWETVELFKELLNVFCIVDDILIVGYDADGRDNDNTLKSVMQICQQENLKLTNNKCYFRLNRIPFFGEIISRNGVKPDSRTLHAVTKLPPLLIGLPCKSPLWCPM